MEINDQMNRRTTYPFAFLIITTCSSAFGDNHINLSDLSNIKVLGHGNDGNDLFCSLFRLNDDQAREFLSRSREIEMQEMHDNYDYLSCYVAGSLEYNKITCSWEIRGGGTAKVICPDTGYLLVCDECDHLLVDYHSKHK